MKIAAAVATFFALAAMSIQADTLRVLRGRDERELRGNGNGKPKGPKGGGAACGTKTATYDASNQCNSPCHICEAEHKLVCVDDAGTTQYTTCN
jgi:hypothetical protein